MVLLHNAQMAASKWNGKRNLSRNTIFIIKWMFVAHVSVMIEMLNLYARWEKYSFFMCVYIKRGLR